MFGRKGVQTADRPLGALAMQAELLLPGRRVAGESVGDRMSREIDQAIEGRSREGSWRAPEGTMLPKAFLEGNLADLRLAREGRFDLVSGEDDRRMLTGHAAVRGRAYESRDLSNLSKGPVSGPALQVMSLAMGSAGRSR